MRYLRSPFCKWVMPMRLVGLVIVLYGFARIFAATDPAGIAIALLGSLAWPAATLLEERSASFQLLQNMPVEKLMRSHLIAVAGSWTLAKVRVSFPAIDDGSFFVTMQDGYLSGIVLPEWAYGVSNDEARHQTMAVAAHPISFVDALRKQDSALTAFSLMERLRRDYLPVTDLREKLVGVITREQIARRLSCGATLGSSEDTHVQASRTATDRAGRLAA
jgi:hypothetical protein